MDLVLSLRHTGPSIAIHPAYSYLDLHEHLGGTGTGTDALDLDGTQCGEEEDTDEVADYDRLDWMVIDIPVKNLAEIALSTELDLTVAISPGHVRLGLTLSILSKEIVLLI